MLLNLLRNAINFNRKNALQSCLQVWDLNDNGEWSCTSSWKTHSASVWRIAWAHPDFGQVLATCSFDRTAAVWEETGMSL